MISEHQFRTIIYYEWRQEHSTNMEIANINNTFGKGTVYRWTVNRWFNRFAAGDTSLEEDERSGRPSTISDDELLRCVKTNPEATTRELATTTRLLS
ncbi:hypothetical protein WR25_06927 [Diploscapter pachys]|uniref:Mos1 transposase HTH domain-containing protein n=1 Tax=Diploscapter pachys TaxID=2018661 RepID=A0A2A2LLZ4_9BILA|nr:hypothetical protein WR25_06927 [Diploscapter pachys]